MLTLTDKFLGVSEPVLLTFIGVTYLILMGILLILVLEEPAEERRRRLGEDSSPDL